MRVVRVLLIHTLTTIFFTYALGGCSAVGNDNVGGRVVLVEDKGFAPQEKTVLFEDDFSSGTFDNWEIKGPWEIVDGQAHVQTVSGWSSMRLPIDSSHYELRFTFTRNNDWNENDFFMVNFRHINADNRVWVAFGPESLHIQQRIAGEFVSLDGQAISNFKKVPYHVRIVAQGSKITVYRGETDKRELVVLSTAECSLLTAEALEISMRAGSDFTLDDVTLLK